MKKRVLKFAVYGIIALASLAGLASDIVLLANGEAGWTLGQGLAFALAFLALFASSLHLAIVAALSLRDRTER